MLTLRSETNAPSAVKDGLVLVKGFIKEDAICAEISHAQIARLLAEGRIVILKDVFSPDLLLKYRSAVTHWRDSVAPFPHGQTPGSQPELNYHRGDTGAFKSAIAHIFHQYCFNKIDQLPEYVGRPTQWIADSVLGLQNAVAGTHFDVSLRGMRVKVLHYPAGGGFLTGHEHPLEPHRVGVITSLARIGEDFRRGGTSFQTPFGRVDTTAQHDIGDIILFRYDLPHAVLPVDEGREINWNSQAGKWSFVLELRETFGLSQTK
jgi:hypothetical protein